MAGTAHGGRRRNWTPSQTSGSSTGDSTRSSPGRISPKPEGRIPAAPVDCCRWFFYVSGHEWDYLHHVLEQQGRPGAALFRVAVTPEEDERLQFEEWRCPLYREGTGCTVYEARPLACRLAGPYLPEQSRLPAHCIFTRPRRYATVEGIPLWEEYVKVLRRHPSPPGYLAPPVSDGPARPGKSPEDPADRP